LFFGCFRKTTYKNGKLTYVKNSPEVHAIFGYLQVEKVLKETFPGWMKYYPHALADFCLTNSNNAIYVSRDVVSWDTSIPGAGPFQFYKGLVLTKDGCSKSKWDLDPDIFKGLEISYHITKNDYSKPWRDDYFQSTAKGQEFVIEENSKVVQWAKRLIEKDTLFLLK